MPHVKAACLDLAFKQSALADDFATNRDYILFSIQQALKSKQYADACKIVEMYCEAGADDREFLLLANLAKTPFDRNDYVIMLAATPFDAYRERIALCEKIIEITPEDAKDYHTERKRCLNALGSRKEEVTALALPVQRVACNLCGSTDTQSVTRKRLTLAGNFLLWIILFMGLVVSPLFLPSMFVYVSLSCLPIPFIFFRKNRLHVTCKSCSAKLRYELPRDETSKRLMLPPSQPDTSKSIALPGKPRLGNLQSRTKKK